jgi:hypothetical protein
MPLMFDDRQLLVVGVQDAALEVVEEHFSRFQRTGRRIKLFEKLREYLAAVKKAGCGIAAIIDGSFVMTCVDEPDDIDLILVLPADWDMTAELQPYQYNLVSKKRVKQEFGLEVFAVPSGSLHEQKWITFFSQVNPKWRQLFGWPEESKKGIVRVIL